MAMFGISCWHLQRERNVELFSRAAKLALIVAVPATLVQLSVGNRFGEAVTSAQGMKIAASEAQWNTCQPCGFSIFQIGGFSQGDETPAFSITIPRLLSWMATGSFSGKVEGIDQLQHQERRSYGGGTYMPDIRLMYWSMRVMAMLGVAMFLIASVGAWLYRKGRLQSTRWFLWVGVIAISFPYVSATAGWILTEMGRQPWIVQNLLKTSDAVSTGLSTATIALSLTVFVALYTALGVVDFVLMRRFATLDPPRADRSGPTAPAAGAPQPHLTPGTG
jgi:cytochrome d ubiquinol oxidase subunit I